MVDLHHRLLWSGCCPGAATDADARALGRNFPLAPSALRSFVHRRGPRRRPVDTARWENGALWAGLFAKRDRCRGRTFFGGRLEPELLRHPRRPPAPRVPSRDAGRPLRRLAALPPHRTAPVWPACCCFFLGFRVAGHRGSRLNLAGHAPLRPVLFLRAPHGPSTPWPCSTCVSRSRDLGFTKGDLRR